MKKPKNLCCKELFLSLFSLAILYIFIGFSNPLNLINDSNNNISYELNESISSESPYVILHNENTKLPSHKIANDNFLNHNFTLENFEDINSDTNKLTQIFFNNDENIVNQRTNYNNINFLSLEPNINPINIAIRSDILII